jgi:hypothetical protein
METLLLQCGPGTGTGLGVLCPRTPLLTSRALRDVFDPNGRGFPDARGVCGVAKGCPNTTSAKSHLREPDHEEKE